MYLWQKFAAAIGLMVVVAISLSPAAGAHAQLVSTNPANGAALQDSPSVVTLEFNEPVEGSLGAVRLYDSSGDRVNTSGSTHPEGNERLIAIEVPNLDDGTYVVAWRITSADSHPVQQAFTFQIGGAAPVDTTSLTQTLLAQSGGSPVVGALFTADRFLLFASLTIFAGTLMFSAWLWPGGFLLQRTRRLLLWSWVVAMATTLLGMGLQGAYAGGFGLDAVFSPSVLQSVLDTRFGRAWALRALALIAVGLFLYLAARGKFSGASRIVKPASVLAAVLLLLPSSLSGHALAQDPVWLAVVLDVIHLAAVTFWLGGLVVLLCCLLQKSAPETGDVREIVERFSRAAFISVVVILVTGSVQAIVAVGSWAALSSTAYGRILTTKLVLVAILIAVAQSSRLLVRRYFQAKTELPTASTTSENNRSALRGLVRWEALVAALVLAVTAALVQTPPPPPAAVDPFNAELVGESVLVTVTVDPPRTGPSEIHYYVLSPAGVLTDVPEFSATMSAPEREVGAIPVPVIRLAPGHYTANNIALPFAGSWEMHVKVRTSEIDTEELKTAFTVQGA